MAGWFFEYLFYFFEIKIESFYFFIFFIYIKIESLLVYSIFDCLVYPHQWSLFCLVYFPFDCWHSRLGYVFCFLQFNWISRCRNSNGKIDGAGDLLTQGSIARGGPLTQGSMLQVDGMRWFIKSSHFSSLGSCFIIYDTCCD